MGREINLDSIRVLDKQIEEYERIIIELKRTRNSLLNVTTLLPPEILGNIFHRNVIPDGDFGGLSKGSYNFLLVCHHWFQVASNTPELWCFWGNSISDWTHRHARCGTGPLDLVLEGYPTNELDDKLRDALQDHAARDTIRRVHLTGFFATKILNPVISSIVAGGEEIRSSGVESFIVESSGGNDVVDISRFFSRYHLPNLKRLRLVGCRISSWDLLKSRTTTLTTLELTGVLSPITPTLSDLLSILSSNPLLQDLTLSYSLVSPVVDGEWPSPLVTLRHLQKFRLTSDFGHAFGLLNRLELPDKMKSLYLDLRHCSPLDTSQILGPYLGDRVRRHGRFPGGGLGLLTTHSYSVLKLYVGDTHKRADFPTTAWFMTVDVVWGGALGKKETEQIGLDLIARIPRERVINLQTALPILRSEELCVEMRDLTYLHLVEVDLSTWFIESDIHGPHTFKELLPSLDRIMITWPTLTSGDWSPFTNFLSRRAAVGNRISSLRLDCHPHMDDDVLETIKFAVKTFEDKESHGGGS